LKLIWWITILLKTAVRLRRSCSKNSPAGCSKNGSDHRRAAAKVKAAALAYARANNAMSFHGLGVTEHSQGAKTVMLITNLAMITGNIGRAGVGVNPLRGQNNVQGSADMGCQPHQGAGYFDMSKTESHDYYSKAYGVASPTSKGKKIPEMYDAMIAGSN
jgi:formate dehydrogenase major subunit